MTKINKCGPRLQRIWKIYHSVVFQDVLLDKTKQMWSRDFCVFSDASEKADAAVIYLNEISGQKSTTNPVFAKSRLTPLKLSIPRLELLAIVIGLRCLKFVRE